MFIKSKSILATGILSFALTQACLSENISGSFVFGDTAAGTIGITAEIGTQEGLNGQTVYTVWSGNNNKSGFSTTSGGQAVEWGYFYVEGTGWGSPDNPDLYVKVWRAEDGRIDVNCFHMSASDIVITCTAGTLGTAADGSLAFIGDESAGAISVQGRYTRLTLHYGASKFEVSAE